MNFLKALQHAFIGYGIRRKSWENKDRMLYYNGDAEELQWVNFEPPRTADLITSILPDIVIDEKDIRARDWEAV